MGGVFRFKKFSVDQTDCAMKVNTDGVLLGAVAAGVRDEKILDIGAGTGVIALMLAQRFPESMVEAVEIDESAANTCEANFKNSPFSNRLRLIKGSFADYPAPDKTYDLIVSNPPFFLDSLKSEKKPKEVARHTNIGFFKDLFTYSLRCLSDQGSLWLILPTATASAVSHLATDVGLTVNCEITIRSFAHSVPHRKIIRYGIRKTEYRSEDLVIYDHEKVYSTEYKKLLQNFLLIF